jgi:hypothetical protein
MNQDIKIIGSLFLVEPFVGISFVFLAQQLAIAFNLGGLGFAVLCVLLAFPAIMYTFLFVGNLFTGGVLKRDLRLYLTLTLAPLAALAMGDLFMMLVELMFGEQIHETYIFMYCLYYVLLCTWVIMDYKDREQNCKYL